MKLKICGITNLEDALAACSAGAWALGFNFYPPSPRYISPEAAREIIQHLPQTVITMGIFIKQPLAEILTLKQQLGLSFLQVYEDFPCSLAEKQQLILSIQPQNHSELPPLKLLQEYAMVLIDAPKDASCLLGGTGRTANWELAESLARDVKLILAGGIHPGNINQAIEQVHPYAIDICSRIESAPGKKDLTLLQQLFDKVNQ